MRIVYQIDSIDQLIALIDTALRDEDVSYARSLAAALKAAAATGRKVDAAKIKSRVIVERANKPSTRVISIVLEREGTAHRWRLSRTKAPGVIRALGLEESEQ